MRCREWARPVRPVQREVLTSQPAGELASEGRPPLLFVPGYGHGAWAFAEHWLEHAAERGFPAYAMSLRGHGEQRHGAGGPRCARTPTTSSRSRRGLPRQAVLVGHGVGALAVAHALARYPARAGVLVAPVFGGWATLGAALRRNPAGTLPALFGGPAAAAPRAAVRPRTARRRGPAVRRPRSVGPARRGPSGSCWPHRTPSRPVGDAAGAGRRLARTTGWCRRRALERAARRYGGAPLLFPGMGHDLMLDARWQEPIDAILDWLDKEPAYGRRLAAGRWTAGLPAGSAGTERRRRSRCRCWCRPAPPSSRAVR